MPRNKYYEHALHIGNHNGNNKWAKDIRQEIDQLHEHDTYKDIGKVPPLKGDKETHAHFVLYVKYDGRHKPSLVVDGNLTNFPLSSVRSGVVPRRGIILVLFIAESHQSLVGTIQWSV